MSNIDKQALREELSNPAIGSNANLRKLALALLDELEVMQKYVKGRDAENEDLMLTIGRLRVEREADKEQIKTLESRNRRLEGIIDAAEKRIAELEARTVNIPDLPADCDRTEAHFKYQEAIREAGIEIAAGIGEGE